MSEITWSIKDWSTTFEVAQSRKYHRLAWVPCPNRHDSLRFRRLVSTPRGVSAFGVFVILVQIASKCPVRGVLSSQDGPLSAHDLSVQSGVPEKAIREAVGLLSSKEIGWLLPVCSQHAPTVLDSDTQAAPTVLDKTRREEIRREEKRKAQGSPPAADTPQKTSENRKPVKSRKRFNLADAPLGFQKFWSEYPSDSRSDPHGCLEVWEAKGLEEIADTVVGSLPRWRASRRWNDGFIAGAGKFLRQEFWTERPEPSADEPAFLHRPISDEDAIALMQSTLPRAEDVL